MAFGIDGIVTEMNSLSDTIKSTHGVCMPRIHQDIDGGSNLEEGQTITYTVSGNTATITETDGSTWIIVENVIGVGPIEIGETLVEGGTITSSDRIQDILDDCILFEVLQIQTLSLDKLKELLSSLSSALSGHGMPCASSGMVDGGKVGEASQQKAEILNKMANGTILNPVLAKMQEATAEATGCKEVYDRLNYICNMFPDVRDFLNKIFAALKKLSDFFDKVVSLLAAIGTVMSCAEELLDAAGVNSPWLSDVNSDFGEVVKSAQDGKAAFPDDPRKAKEFVKNQVKDNLGLEKEMSDNHKSLIDLNALF